MPREGPLVEECRECSLLIGPCAGAKRVAKRKEGHGQATRWPHSPPSDASGMRMGFFTFDLTARQPTGQRRQGCENIKTHL